MNQRNYFRKEEEPEPKGREGTHRNAYGRISEEGRGKRQISNNLPPHTVGNTLCSSFWLGSVPEVKILGNGLESVWLKSLCPFPFYTKWQSARVEPRKEEQSELYKIFHACLVLFAVCLFDFLEEWARYDRKGKFIDYPQFRRRDRRNQDFYTQTLLEVSLVWQRFQMPFWKAGEFSARWKACL